MLLADRFQGNPVEYWAMDTLERARLLNLLGIEGEVAGAFEGLGPDDTLVGYGPDGWE